MTSDKFSVQKICLCVLSLKNLTRVRFFDTLPDNRWGLGETSPNESLALFFTRK